MFDTSKIEQITRQLHNALPKGVRGLGDDIEQKFRQVLRTQLIRMDLITREEFDIQAQVLLRTREKLAALEQRIAQLEAGTSGNTGGEVALIAEPEQPTP